MTKQTPLTADARQAFAAYSGLGRRIIDDLIAEVERLTHSHAALLAAAKEMLDLYGGIEISGMQPYKDCWLLLEAAIAAAEEPAP